MKQIVILGGGVCGRSVAEKLSVHINPKSITLVSEHAYYVKPFGEYFALQSKENSLELSHAKQEYALSYEKFASRLGINFLLRQAERIDFSSRVVFLRGKRVGFDYLVSCLGSAKESLGPAQYAMPMHSLVDALRVRNSVEFAIEQSSRSIKPHPVRIVVVGGGMRGVETIIALRELVKFICSKNGFSQGCVELVLLEAEGRLLHTYTAQSSEAMEQYIYRLGVNVQYYSEVTNVSESCITLKDGYTLMADVVIWAASSSGQKIDAEPDLSLSNSGRLLVNKKFQVRPYTNVFSIGDQAAPPFPHRLHTVENAEAEAQYVANIIPALMQNKRIISYTPLPKRSVTPLARNVALYIGRNFSSIGMLPDYYYRARQWLRAL